MNQRIKRLEEDLKRILSDIIRNELKDPGLSRMVTISNLTLTRDLKHAKIYLSIYGNEEEIKNTLAILEKSTGYLRKEIGKRIRIRYAPELHFELDKSIEYGIRITEIINKIKGAEDTLDVNESDT